MDDLTLTAQSLGSPNVVVLTKEDLDRIGKILYRAGEEGFLTEEERLAIQLVEICGWTCDGAARASV